MFIQSTTMTKLTKKYVFKRRLDGKPIIIYVTHSHGRWATKEDIKLLKKYGIIVPYEGDRLICTHKILTYALPFNPHNGHVAQTEKGEILGRSNKSAQRLDL